MTFEVDDKVKVQAKDVKGKWVPHMYLGGFVTKVWPNGDVTVGLSSGWTGDQDSSWRPLGEYRFSANWVTKVKGKSR